MSSSNDGENILERSGATKRSVWNRSNRHYSTKNRQIAKSREYCSEKILESTKEGCTIRGEIGISDTKSRIARSKLLCLRKIETGNNEVLKRILDTNKKSKWWETTRKYMNWAQIEEQEMKEIKRRIAKVVEEEWTEE